MKFLRRMVCTAGWTIFAYTSFGIAFALTLGDRYRAMGEPAWMTVIAVGGSLCATVAALWFGLRGRLPGTEPTFNLRSLIRAGLVLGAVVIAGAVCLDRVASSTENQKPQSPKHARSVAEAQAYLDQPLLRSIGISQREILEALEVTTPLTPDEGEPVMGHRKLVGYNQQDGIQVIVQGPEQDLWSTSVTMLLESGKLGPEQPSTRLLQNLTNRWLGQDAWGWISQMADTLLPNGTNEQRVQRNFGDKSVTLRMSGPSAENPAALGILVLPLIQGRQWPGGTRQQEPDKHQPNSRNEPPKATRQGYHPLD